MNNQTKPPISPAIGTKFGLPNLADGQRPNLPALPAATLWRLLVGTGLLLHVLHLAATGWAVWYAGHHWFAYGTLCYRCTFLAALLLFSWLFSVYFMGRTAWRLHRSSRNIVGKAVLLAQPLPPRLEQKLTALRLHWPVTLFASDQPAAFAAGWRRPRIFLSTGLLAQLDEGELTAVLRHEARHVAKGDPWRQAAVQILLAGLPGIALGQSLYRRLRLASELEADAAALADPQDRWSLAAALVKVAKRSPSRGTAPLDAGLADEKQAAAAAVVTGLNDMLHWRLAYLTGAPLPPAVKQKRVHPTGYRWRWATGLALLVAAALACPGVGIGLW